jgi:Bacteriocin-protection, YdeI or OmpD-Associated
MVLLRERTRPGLGIIEPCLPSPAKAPPSGTGWLHEIKHDGFRILARRERMACGSHAGNTDTHEVEPPSGASNRMIKPISGGVAHDLPPDLRKVLTSDRKALTAWEDLTPLARNEWICWAISVKKPETRREHVERVCAQLKEGVRRPCCWMGCTHRTDKSLSPSQKFILGKRSKK